jgi:hypothetical protein
MSADVPKIPVYYRFRIVPGDVFVCYRSAGNYQIRSLDDELAFRLGAV